MSYTLNGKSLSECSYSELVSEWYGGMYMESAAGLSTEQFDRLLAVERAMLDAYDALPEDEKKRLEQEE